MNEAPEMTFWTTFRVDPIGKPRMTQRDKWRPSMATKRYHSFKDKVLAHVLESVELRNYLKRDDVFRVDWKAFLPIPISWTKSKKEGHAGAMHRQKPDKDNIEKALLDALFHEDSGIAAGEGLKFWDDGKGPRIEVTLTGFQKGGEQ